MSPSLPLVRDGAWRRARFVPVLGLLVALFTAAAVEAAAPRQEITLPAPGPLVGMTEVGPEEREFRQGVAAYETGQYADAARLWQRPAELGHSEAQFSLGIAHALGRGTLQDLSRAIALWEAAAYQGHAAAQFNLGLLFARGEGVEKNPAKAEMWWYMAGINGDPAAQFHLGAMAATGDNGARNYEEAVWWWRRAAAQGYQLAIKGLEILRTHGALRDQ